MTTAATAQRPRPGLLELGLGLIVLGPWLVSTIAILTGPFDLAYTTSNVAWQMLLAYALPTALLALAAAVSRTRLLAVLAVVAAGIEIVGLAAVLIVHAVLGARADLTGTAVATLLYALGAGIAAVLALLATRSARLALPLRIAALVVAVATLVIRHLVALVSTVGLLVGVGDPSLAVPLLGGLLPLLLIVAGMAVAAVRSSATRWIAGGLVALGAVLELTLVGLRFAFGIDAMSLLSLVDVALTLVGGALVAWSASALARSRRADASGASAAAAGSPPAWATAPAATDGQHLPPPAPGTQVRPPQ
ncbi:hypothetical protein GCM10009846_18010 [Agrococcus versicolor]|uniref:Uncharacterized protein n=1 Tax=Agrococcus versicolor TaxID=501482 RepID=A0ABP5MLE5_9MICO